MGIATTRVWNGIEEDEYAIGFKSRDNYNVKCTINTDVRVRMLTTTEAVRCRDLGVIIDDDTVDDNNQEFVLSSEFFF